MRREDGFWHEFAGQGERAFFRLPLPGGLTTSGCTQVLQPGRCYKVCSRMSERIRYFSEGPMLKSRSIGIVITLALSTAFAVLALLIGVAILAIVLFAVLFFTLIFPRSQDGPVIWERLGLCLF